MFFYIEFDWACFNSRRRQRISGTEECNTLKNQNDVGEASAKAIRIPRYHGERSTDILTFNQRCR